MGINNVPQALAHLPAVRRRHKAVRVDRLRLGQTGALEDARPDDAVEPRDVLPDYVHVGWPERCQRVIRVLKTAHIAQTVHTVQTVHRHRAKGAGARRCQ